MEAWRRIWRDGICPQLSFEGLVALRRALMIDDPRLIQGATCHPHALEALGSEDIDAACAIGWCGWQGDGRSQVATLEEFFENVCAIADSLLDEPGACRHFIDWFDSVPREEMRSQLLREVTIALRDQSLLAAV